jgi:hypothetical protein
MKHTHTTDDARCPKCSKPANGASGTDDRGPAPEDLSVCAYCGAVLVFNLDLTVREATHADIEKLPPQLAWKLGQFVGAVHLRLKGQSREH